MGEALVDGCLQRVVIGVRVALHQEATQSGGRQIAEAGEERSSQTSNCRYSGERWAKRLVEREQARELAAFRTDVAQVQHPVVEETPLHSEIEGLHIRDTPIVQVRIDPGGWNYSARGNSTGERPCLYGQDCRISAKWKCAADI